ncbi:MAG TPA: hypothetical protein VLX68_05100 [Chitinivibrionales bacterium]|nr:hypothetical protein [Chitinivibrionales bacterium]
MNPQSGMCLGNFENQYERKAPWDIGQSYTACYGKIASMVLE